MLHYTFWPGARDRQSRRRRAISRAPWRLDAEETLGRLVLNGWKPVRRLNQKTLPSFRLTAAETASACRNQ